MLYVAFPAKLKTFNEKQLLENKPLLFFLNALETAFCADHMYEYTNFDVERDMFLLKVQWLRETY